MRLAAAPPGSVRDTLLAQGILTRADVHVAETVGRLTGEDRDEVLLAAALAARAPRHGHVCVLPREAAVRVASEVVDGSALPEIAWPDPDAWLEALASSPSVRTGAQETGAPLVLHDERLYLDRYWRYQSRLAADLTARAAGHRDDVDTALARRRLAELFPGSDGEPDRQAIAAALACIRDLTVVSGAPGTGKTSTVVRLLALLVETAATSASVGGLRVAMVAPTGKAAARMEEAVRDALGDIPAPPEVRARLAEIRASTIHRLLGWQPRNPSRFRHDADTPLPHDVVVVDEASMVPLALMAKLVAAVRSDARLVLVGDRDQLASVEAGSVLGDICGPVRAGESGALHISGETAARLAELTTLGEIEAAPEPGIWDSVVHLERFHRFGVDSGIGAVARAIQSGADPAARTLAYLRGEATESGSGGAYADVALAEPDEHAPLPDGVRDDVVAGYHPYLEAVLGGADGARVLDLFDTQRVLCAVRRGPHGAEVLNAAIEGWLAEGVDGFVPRGAWYLGRPVIVTENDYGVGLYNGDVGVVVRDPDDPARRVVAFPTVDGPARLISPSRIPSAETVFATTVHKSQGSQHDRVVVVLPTVASPVLTRELVYTAVTRARSHATVVATQESLAQAVATPIQRASGLGPILWGDAEPARRSPGRT